jgi:hypothetical protein
LLLLLLLPVLLVLGLAAAGRPTPPYQTQKRALG